MSEWQEVGEWIFENKEYFTALSFLPEDLELINKHHLKLLQKKNLS
jgi:hypothetical protein